MPNNPVTHQEMWDFRDGVYKFAGCVLLFMLLLVGAVIFMFWRITFIVDGQHQETINRQVAQCESANDFRTTFRNILKQVAEQGTGEPIDLTALAGFDDLDVRTQEWVRSLSAVVASGGPNERLLAIRSEYIRDFPLVNCEALRKKLEKDHA